MGEARREMENFDFEEAKKEMTQAVDALEEAVEVLGEATEDHKEGTLLQAKTEQTVGFADRSAQAAALQHAVQLGERFLGKGDALFLRRVLTGEVPKADWKAEPQGNFQNGIQSSIFQDPRCFGKNVGHLQDQSQGCH